MRKNDKPFPVKKRGRNRQIHPDRTNLCPEFAENKDLFEWGHFESLTQIPGISGTQYGNKDKTAPPGIFFTA
jgi:hypothetical protein